MAPRVSVNICCYNSERFLEETLQSVFSQTYTDWELVIVDDGSTDATGEIIGRHVAEGRQIVHLAQVNAGLSASRNRALRQSSGEFVAFLDHDDLWEPQKLERQIPLFDRRASVGVVYSDCLNFGEDGVSYRHFERYPPTSGMAFGSLLRNYFLNLQTVVVRRAAIDQLPEWFDEELELAEEADLFLRIAHTWELDYVDEPLARWRLHAASLSQRRRERFPAELERVVEKQEALDPAFMHEYAEDARAFRDQIVRLRARIAWDRGRYLEALRLLGPNLAASVSIDRMRSWLGWRRA